MPIAWKLFIACIAIQLLYYLVVFARLNFIRVSRSMPETFPPVSIIICARNEARNLEHYLKVVLIQQYKQFEVVLVNDQSDDDTIDVMVDYYTRNSNIKIVNIEKEASKPYAGKKYALMRGIDVATYDTFVLTDADCRPGSTHWLTKMVGNYLYETKFVLGHSPYEKAPGFLNKIIRYENFMTALQYFGFASIGQPYMGVGRNLSYKKEVFNSFHGFEKNKDILSGDDDLLVNEIATGKNTELCLDKDAFTYSKAETTLQSWLEQKKRHLRTGFKYKFLHQALLFLFAFSTVGVYISTLAVLASMFMLKWWLAVLCGFLFVKLLITFKVYKRLGAEDLRFFSPILDVTYALYLLTIFALLMFKPKDTWKS